MASSQTEGAGRDPESGRGVSVTISIDGPEPPYVQIRAQITRLISAGKLVEGTPLPTIRQLAGDLGLANNTVARAYRELEADGLIRSHGRRGTVVSGLTATRAQPAQVTQEVRDFVERTRALGLDASTTLRLVSDALSR